MRHLILYNPLAGGGRAKSDVDALSVIYPDAERCDMTKITSYTSLLAGISDDDRITVCGGDGTLNRFVNAISNVKIPCRVFYYATGTGNDFLRDVCGTNTSPSPIEITKHIKSLPTVTVKNKEYKFINGVGYGIDGYCCEVGDELRGKSDKPVNYTSIAIKGLLFHYTPTRAKVTVDGKKYTFEKVWIAPTMNGRFYGGGMMPTPEQDRLNGTGELSLMLMHTRGRLRTLMLFPSIFKGEHLKDKKAVTLIKGHDIEVEFDRPTALQIDGETVLGVMSYRAKSHALAKEKAKM